STGIVCLVPFFPRSTGLGPVSSPPPKARRMTESTTTTSGSSLPARFSRPSRSACRRSHTPSSLPQPQAALGGPAGAAHLRGHVLVAAAGGQDEPEDVQHGPVRLGRAAALGAARLLRRQVVANQLEELVGHARGGHGCSPRGASGPPQYASNLMPDGFCQ